MQDQARFLHQYLCSLQLLSQLVRTSCVSRLQQTTCSKGMHVSSRHTYTAGAFQSRPGANKVLASPPVVAYDAALFDTAHKQQQRSGR